jgi:hypothetical protein
MEIATAADDMHESPLLVGETFERSIIKKISQPGTDRHLFQYLGLEWGLCIYQSHRGCQFLAVLMVIVKAIRSLDATFTEPDLQYRGCTTK